MSAAFPSGATNNIKNVAPFVVNVPLTVGFWAYPTATGTLRTLFCLGDTGADTYLSINQTSGNLWQITATAAGSANNATTGAVTANSWFFIVGRFISATNRRLAVLAPDGSASAVQATTSRTMSSIDTMTLGQRLSSTSNQPFAGRLANFWYTNNDVQPDGAALTDSLLRQLAYGGPFSVPSIANTIIEHRSLRTNPINGESSDISVGGGAPAQNWANTSGVTIGAHPPLPYWYANLQQTKRATVPI